ncbi:MAG: CinA family protein [Ruminococcus sp.]|nr:CinA family protein [Ruminococcus sp.]MCD7801218.1 CinA family protein [Ruminococcus sp.]
MDSNNLKISYSPISTIDDTSMLAKKMVTLLKNSNLTIAVAESCTGGMISQAITSIPGASSVYEFGVCTYSNRMKTEFLNVSPVILDALGTVSYETAEAMAKGLKIRSGADICVSVTGFAGPTSDINTPIGTVYVGIYFKERTFVRLLKLWGMGYDRDTIRRKTTICVFEIVISMLENIQD